MRWTIALLLAPLALLASCESAKDAQKGQSAAVGPGAAKPTKGAPGAPAAPPPITIAAWFGSEPITLDDLKAKVVILDFWNTGCPPCRKLMPHLAELYAKHKAEGLVVIGITEDEKADLEAFLKANPVAYPIAMDAVKGGAGQTFEAYKIGSIPTVCLIARDGSLAWKGPGDELTDAKVLAELAKK